MVGCNTKVIFRHDIIYIYIANGEMTMMFIMHLSFSIGLIALMGALSMFIWGLRTEGPGKELAKFFGILITVFIIIDFICIGYYALNYWREGYFENPTTMMSHGNSMNPNK